MMTKALLLFCGAFLLAVTLQLSFVDTAPTKIKQDDPDREPDPISRNLESIEDANVKDLESLKHSIDQDGRGVTTFAGHPHQANKEETRGAEPETAEVQDRSEAGNNEEFTKNGNRRNTAVIPYRAVAPLDVDKAISEVAALAAVAAVDDVRNHSGGHRSGVQYTSLDMAEYIFWTGDEKGVSVAIEEFLQEGLMSREEAISFLQEIKYNLDYLEKHYSKMGLNAVKGHIKDDPLALASGGTSSAIPLFSKDKQRINGKPTLNNNFEITRLRQEPVTKKDLHAHLAENKNTDTFPHSGTSSISNLSFNNPSHQDQQARQLLFDKLQQYTLANQERLQPERPSMASSTASASLESNTVELLDRLHTADMLYTEYSLEEVIYQLARVMFQQALMRGDAEAQQTLHRFTQFLETEADQARISRSLEKTVFDVLIAALADTLSEHPELTNTAPTLAQTAADIIQKQQQRVHGTIAEVPMGDRNAILRQILQMGAQHAEETQQLGGFGNEMGPMRIAINTVKYKAK